MKEITSDDPFGEALTKFSTGKNVGLEIGGGTGEGSTVCIKTEMLFSIENSPDRWQQHAINVTRHGQFPIYGTATMPSNWMAWMDVCEFHARRQTPFSGIPLKTVREWFDLSHAEAKPFYFGAIRALAHKLTRRFDFVLIDGGPFSGHSELMEVARYLAPGAVIALDDTNDIKNFHNYQILKRRAKLRWESDYRNGAAIFQIG